MRRNSGAIMFLRRRTRRAGALAAGLLLALAAAAASAATIEIDLAARYGPTHDGVAQALAEARRVLGRDEGDEVVIRFPAGTFELADDDARAAIDVSDLVPGDRGRLVIAGRGMDRTHLVIAERLVGIYGRNVRHLVVQDLQFSRPRRTVTQGRVTAVAAGSVTLAIDPGFPAPADLVDPTPLGHWLRACAPGGEAMRFPAERNEQLAWTQVARTPDGRWRFTLREGGMPPYEVGALVAVKSKHGGNAYWFHGGTDVTFQRVRWLDESRGTFRGGMSRIRILDSRIERTPIAGGAKPCLATPDGGPQIGNPDDPPTREVLVQGNVFENTGDDAIALFNASGVVAGNTVSDSFARGILLFRSKDVELRGNEVIRSPVLHVDK
jgi:parallel beta-helix repeat protein